MSLLMIFKFVIELFSGGSSSVVWIDNLLDRISKSKNIGVVHDNDKRKWGKN